MENNTITYESVEKSYKLFKENKLFDLLICHPK